MKKSAARIGHLFRGILLSYVRSSSLALLCAAFMTAPAAFAGTTPDMTPPSLALDAFLAQSRLLHDTSPKPQSNVQPQAATADAGKPLTAAASSAINDVLSKSGAPLDAESTGLNLAIGQGRLPAVPAMAELDHATARAMVAAFPRPAGGTAEDQAQIAAAASSDPAMDEKIGLVRTLYRVDGTDALLRRFVATQHMRLIITEVNNHIEINKLSEADRYRLSAIAAQAETELEDKILTMDARAQARALSKPELLNLITAFDSDAQRKMTQMRLADSGKLDRGIDLDVSMAQIQIVKRYESGE